MKRFRRRFGTVLIVLGVTALGYGATVYLWHDPVTDLYARWKQHQLSSQLEESFADYRASAGLPADLEPAEAGDSAQPNEAAAPAVPTESEQSAPAETEANAANVAALEAATLRAAETFYAGLEEGQPLGRITIPKLGVDPIFVNGTRWGADLSRGPGRYPETFVPGMGKLTAIAGHRTTFGAWFRKIDKLTEGDEIRLDLPYGTFHYRVTSHEIVDDEDWSVIRQRGFDTLVLSACHPLYSASQRWIVYARLVEVDLPGGASYALPAAGEQQVAASATS
jgi:sortase A